MKRMMTVVVLVMAVLLSACTESNIIAGDVVKKEHHKAYTVENTTLMPVGASGVMIPISDTTERPETWEIQVRGHNYATGRDETRSFEVSKTIYDKFEIGDYYNFKDNL